MILNKQSNKQTNKQTNIKSHKKELPDFMNSLYKIMFGMVRVQIELVVWSGGKCCYTNLYIPWSYVESLGKLGNKV